MPTCKQNLLAVFTGLGLATLAGQASAFDPEKVFKPDEQPRTILKYGLDAFKSGRNEEALGAFRYGAVKNHVPSQWKLARMLQKGEGVKKDHFAAFQMYMKIARRFAENMPDRHDMPYVSHAVVTLGIYLENGIKSSPVNPNPRRAENFYYRASAIYRDAEAQYRLGKLYLGDKLGAPRLRTAARWFSSATKKGHALAQAELGRMMFYGEGVRRNRVKGLVYMTRAKARATGQGLGDIIQLDDVYAEANEDQRSAAAKIIEKLALKSKSLTLQPNLGFRSNATVSE